MANEPQILDVPTSDPEATPFLLSLKQGIEFMLGQGNNLDDDRALRVRELVKFGVDITGFLNSNVNNPYSLTHPSSGSSKMPNAPYDLSVVKGPFVHTLYWTNPTESIVSHIEVWVAKDSQSIDDAILTGIVTVTEDLRGEEGTYKHSGFAVTSDYTYWIRAISYGGKHSEWNPTLAQGGYAVPGDDSVAETIDQIIDMLQGSTPDAYSAGTTYYFNDRCRTTDGRVWKSIYAGGDTSHSGNEPPNATYWERSGILMQGDVDGTPTVAIDGNFVVDGTILADAIQAGAITAAKLAANQILVGHTIESANFVTGTTGWQINGVAETAEFNDIVMTFTSGLSAAQTALNVADGADNTQIQLDLGAAIDNAIANGVTLISGGYIRTALLHTDVLIIGVNAGGLAVLDRSNLDYTDGADATQAALTAGADIVNAMIGAVTFISGGYIRTALLDADSVHAGAVTLKTTGYLKTLGKDSYADTTAGVWIGYDSGLTAYTLNIGDATKFLKWSGTALTVGGDIIATGNINDNAITQTVSSASSGVSITTAGGKTLAGYSCQVTLYMNDAVGSGTITISNGTDAATLGYSQYGAQGDTIKIPVAGFVVAPAGTATKTYTVSLNGAGVMSLNYTWAMETKK
jgi:hypothetical protein